MFLIAISSINRAVALFDENNFDLPQNERTNKSTKD